MNIETVQRLRVLYGRVEEVVYELDLLIREIGGGVGARDRPGEKTLRLDTNEAVFKGKRPVGVVFPNGKRVDASTWRRVFEVILRDCNSVPEKHEALMELRGTLFGRTRVLLDKQIGDMHSPLEIDRDLYAETNYDVPSLLGILKNRILVNVNYPYKDIKIVVRGH